MPHNYDYVGDKNGEKLRISHGNGDFPRGTKLKTDI